MIVSVIIFSTFLLLRQSSQKVVGYSQDAQRHYSVTVKSSTNRLTGWSGVPITSPAMFPAANSAFDFSAVLPPAMPDTKTGWLFLQHMYLWCFAPADQKGRCPQNFAADLKGQLMNWLTSAFHLLKFCSKLNEEQMNNTHLIKRQRSHWKLFSWPTTEAVVVPLPMMDDALCWRWTIQRKPDNAGNRRQKTAISGNYSCMLVKRRSPDSKSVTWMTTIIRCRPPAVAWKNGLISGLKIQFIEKPHRHEFQTSDEAEALFGNLWLEPLGRTPADRQQRT